MCYFGKNSFAKFDYSFSRTFCSNRPQLRFAKRWKHSLDGPISIDFIHQMLESRKVKSYPYRAEMDPYLV